MSNMFGRTEEVFGVGYDKGHFVGHGAGGGGDWNLFPQLRSLNRGWSGEGNLYRKMEAFVAAHESTMCFSRPIDLDGSLCPTLLEYGVLSRTGKSGGPPSPTCRMQRSSSKPMAERRSCPCRRNWLAFPTADH